MNVVNFRSSLSLGGANGLPAGGYLRKCAVMSDRIEATDRYLLGLATKKINNVNMIDGVLNSPLNLSSKYTFDEEIDYEIESSTNRYIECGRCLIFNYINGSKSNLKELESALLENLIEFNFTKQEKIFSVRYLRKRELALFLEKITGKNYVVDNKYYFTYKNNNTEIIFDNVNKINAKTLCPDLDDETYETNGSILFGKLNVRNLKTIQTVYFFGKTHKAKFEDEKFIKKFEADEVKISCNTALRCRLRIHDNPFNRDKKITIIEVYDDFIYSSHKQMKLIE